MRSVYRRPGVYRAWAGSPNGTPENGEKCIEVVHDTGRSILSHQCSRRRGKGPDGLFCTVHAKRYDEDAKPSAGGMR